LKYPASLDTRIDFNIQGSVARLGELAGVRCEAEDEPSLKGKPPPLCLKQAAAGDAITVIALQFGRILRLEGGAVRLVRPE
jgi:hypothetical protein